MHVRVLCQLQALPFELVAMSMPMPQCSACPAPTDCFRTARVAVIAASVAVAVSFASLSIAQKKKSAFDELVFIP